MSSRVKRAKVVELLKENSFNHPDNYSMYIVAAIVGWYFRDHPEGMSTINQVKVCNFVHLHIAALQRDENTEEIYAAHAIMHELEEELIEKLKAKGIISADDDGFTDDDELLNKHKNDFSKWAEELDLTDEESD